MAHINEVLNEIKQFLEGQDQSCTGKFRALAAEYAEICKDLAAQLEECRQLIRSGNSDQAVSRNHENSPALTERAHILIFPGHSQWITLCLLYQVPLPPEIDMEFVHLLESQELNSSVLKSADLKAQWRILGRTGTPHEKILLLRKLIKADNTTQVWRKNLEIAEKSWVLEQMKNAETAQKLGDMARLLEICQSLTSEEMLHPLPSSALQPFQDSIRAYKAKLLQNKKKELLEKIAEAYSCEDILQLGVHLSEWDAITGNPFFTPPSQEELDLLNKAQEHFQEKTKEAELNKEIAELEQEIAAMMERGADFPSIRKRMFRLQELNGALKPELISNYKQLENEFATTAARKAANKRLLWGIGLVLFCAAIALTIYILNERFDVNTICREMQNFIKDEEPQKAIDYFQRLEKERQNDPAIKALHEKAKNAVAKQQSDIKSYADLLQQITPNLTLEKIEFTLPLFTQIERSSLHHTEEQFNELTKLKIKRDELLQKRKELREAEFIKRTNALESRAKHLFYALKNPASLNIEAARMEYKQLMSELKKLSIYENMVEKNLFKYKKDLLMSAVSLLPEKMAFAEKYMQVKTAIYSPNSIDDFLEALKQCQGLGDLEQQFGIAIVNEGNSRQFCNISQGIIDNQSNIGINPYLSDYWFIMPRKNAPELLKEKIKEIQTIVNQWKIAEFSVQNNGEYFYFYVKDPKNYNDLTVERFAGRAGGAYRFVRFNASQPGNRTISVTYTVKRQKDGSYQWDIFHGTGNESFPKTISGITVKQMQNLNEGRLPLALHYTKFIETLERLKGIAKNEQLKPLLLAEIRNYISDSSINPAAKAIIIRELIKLFKCISPIDEAFADQIILQQLITLPDPLDFSKGKTQIEKFLKFFDSPDFNKILVKKIKTEDFFKKMLQQMRPESAGIIYIDNKGSLTFHFFNGFQDQKSYFVFIKGHFYMLPQALRKKGKHTLSELHGELKQLWNGSVIYTAPVKTFIRDAEKADLLKIPETIPMTTGDQQ